MARINFKATVVKTYANNRGVDIGFSGGGDPVIANQATVTAAEATVNTDVATLVADGATPTQAHVNTLNTDWGTLKTAIDAMTVANSGDVSVSVDLANVTTKNQLRAAFAELLKMMESSGNFS